MIGIIYGALVAMVQPDMKKLVAYSSVSHLGFVVLGLCAMNQQGVQGSLYQMLNHGVSTGGLFMHRRHALRSPAHAADLGVRRPQGRRCRRLVAAFLLITLSSIALPGMNGFVGEFLILIGAFRWHPRLTVFAATGVILSAVYMLWMFQRVNYGPVTNEKNRRAARPHAARVGADGADDRDGDLHGRVPGRLPAADGAVGRADHRAGQRLAAGARRRTSLRRRPAPPAPRRRLQPRPRRRAGSPRDRDRRPDAVAAPAADPDAAPDDSERRQS